MTIENNLTKDKVIKPSKKGLKLMYTNADQFVNKRDDLVMMISGDEPDVILITEVIPKCQANPINPALLAIQGYIMHCNFNPEESYLGTSGKRGVVIYYKEELSVNEIHIGVDGFLDHAWIEIKGKNSSLICGCVYRSPSDANKEAQLHSIRKVNSLIKKIVELYDNVVITGDFNLKEIDWTNEHVPPEKDHLLSFISNLQECFLYQHIIQPTRFRQNEEPNILDLILSSEEGMIQDLRYLPPLGESDHVTLRFNVSLEKDTSNNWAPRRNIYKGNYVAMKEILTSHDWDDILKIDFEEAYDRFSSILQTCIDQYCPLQTPPKKKKNLYMTQEALRLKNAKNRAWRSFKQDPSIFKRYAYIRKKNRLRSLTRRLRRDFELQLAKKVKGKPKLFWKYVRSRLKTRQTIPSLYDNDITASTDIEKAELLNDFFVSVFTIEDTDSIPEGVPSTLEKLTNFIITSEMVQNKLKNLNPNKSPGHDEFHPHLLRELAEPISLPLSILFNKSLKEGAHSTWKKAIITAVFKKDSRSSPNNYRPVSLTSVISKVMESIVRDKILDHLMSNNIFCDNQHGFVPGRDCMTQLLLCLEEWTQLIEDGECIDIIYTDFKKAFDSVAHQRLLVKLHNLGIDGRVLDWIRSFLTNREQSVRVNQECSKWSKVISGIPQGSVIGPLLFVVFINDMPMTIKNMCKLFADDCKLYGAVKSDNCSMQEDLTNMYKWSKRWQLPFNETKCKVMHIGRRNPHKEYQMEGHILEESTCEKDLGVNMDNELKFHVHSSIAIKKANQILGVIKRSCCTRDRTTIPLLYKSMVRPHLEYGNIIWGPFYKKDMKAVESIQRRATKLVEGLKTRPYEERLKILDIPSLVYRRRRGDMIQVFKICKKLVRLNTCDLFKITEGITRGHQWKVQ